MLKTVHVGNKIVFEYTHYAFHTEKGTFTLVGSDTNGTDTFKCLTDGSYHEWNRSQVYEWLVIGQIKPQENANTLDWYLILEKEKNRLNRLKSSLIK